MFAFMIGFFGGTEKWILGREKVSFFQLNESFFQIFVRSEILRRSEDFQDSQKDDLVDPTASRTPQTLFLEKCRFLKSKHISMFSK